MTNRLLIISSTFVRYLCTILAGVILSRGFSKSDFGTFMQATLWISSLTEIAGMGIPKALLYFAGRTGNTRNAVYHCLLLALGSSLIGALVSWAAWGFIAQLFKNPGLAEVLAYVVLTLPFKILSIALMNALIVAGRIGKMSLITSAVSPLILIGFGLAVHAKAGIGAIFALQLAVEIFQVAAFLLLFRASACPGKWDPDPGLARSILAYCLPLLVTIGTLLAGKRLDSFLIASYFDPAVFAIYSRGALELPFAQLILFNVAAMLMPEFARLHRDQENDRITGMIAKEVKRNALLLFPSFFGIALVHREFIEFLYSAKYVESSGVFLVYLVLIPLQLFAFDMVIQAMNKSAWVTLAAAISIAGNLAVTLGLMRWLGPLAPAVGMIASTAITIAINLAVINSSLANPLRRWLPWGHLIKLAAIAALPLALLLPCKNAFQAPTAFKVFFYPAVYFLLDVPLLWACGLIPKEIQDKLVQGGKRYLPFAFGKGL